MCSELTSVKDPPPLEKRSVVVNWVPCSCGWVYTGGAIWQLECRLGNTNIPAFEDSWRSQLLLSCLETSLISRLSLFMCAINVWFELLLMKDTHGESGWLDHMGNVDGRDNLIASGWTKLQLVLHPCITIFPMPVLVDLLCYSCVESDMKKALTQQHEWKQSYFVR